VGSSFGFRVMGVPLPLPVTATPAVVAPSVGCPMGCDFCTTSAFFGGKGKVHSFFKDGAELFDALCEIDSRLRSQSFFLLDENFLLDRDRALQLLERMRQHDKSWELYVFSSAHAIAQYPVETLVELGVSWIWIGLESPRSEYQKLRGLDTIKMVRELREHGIRTLGSTIIGLPHHTLDNVREEIAHEVSHETDFHQFMLYTPLPGTPLHDRAVAEGSFLHDVAYADMHGQFAFNFRHPGIPGERSKELLDWAFRLDYEKNGPSIFRFFRTTLAGWRRYLDHPDRRVRRRFRRELRLYRYVMDAGLRTMEHRLALDGDRAVREGVSSLRQQLATEYGPVGSWVGAAAAPILFGASILEELRLARGWTYEPRPMIERHTSKRPRLAP